MTIVNYDHAVTYYDATRAYPVGVAEQIQSAIVDVVGADKTTQFLELAIGTGIIGVPFINAGYNYVGVDISAQMMMQIADKLTHKITPKVVQSNVMQPLPFAPDSFDVVNAIRIFHMLDNWQATVDTVSHIIKPSGYLIIAHELIADTTPYNPLSVTNKKWHNILDSLGRVSTQTYQSLWQKLPAIQAYLTSIGVDSHTVDLCHFKTIPRSIRMTVESHRQRTYRTDWTISDTMYAEGIKLLDAWMTTECESPDALHSIPMIFRALVAQW